MLRVDERSDNFYIAHDDFCSQEKFLNYSSLKFNSFPLLKERKRRQTLRSNIENKEVLKNF